MDKVVNGQRVSAVLVMRNKDNTLTVNVSVEPFEETGKEVRLTAKDILHYLAEKEIEVSKCIQSSVVSNKNENSLFGTWIFELPFKEETNSLNDVAQEITEIEDARILDELTALAEETESSSQDDSKTKRGRKRIVKKEE